MRCWDSSPETKNGKMTARLKPIKYGRFTLNFDRTLIMGILNVTPDSFSDGGLFFNANKAIHHGISMAGEGADIIDVGGESTRPGSEPISTDEEMSRVLPIVEALSQKVDVPISIDTYKPEVAEACMKAGASMINDVYGLGREGMLTTATKWKAPVVLMHMKGTPKTMNENPQYTDVMKEIYEFLHNRIEVAREAGLEQIIVDPGMGFGKKREHDLTILAHLSELKSLKCPILVGPSRKSFIGGTTKLPVNERLESTIAAATVAVMNGANIVRVHDVKPCKRALMVVDEVKATYRTA